MQTSLAALLHKLILRPLTLLLREDTAHGHHTQARGIVTDGLDLNPQAVCEDRVWPDYVQILPHRAIKEVDGSKERVIEAELQRDLGAQDHHSRP